MNAKLLNKLFSIVSTLSLLINSFGLPAVAYAQTASDSAAPTAIETPTETPTPTGTLTPTDTVTSTDIVPETPDTEGVVGATIIQDMGSTTAVANDIYSYSGLATITTEKTDYSPSETAIITGKGFKPDTAYDLEIVSGGSLISRVSVQTDSSGLFSYPFYLGGVFRPNYEVFVKSGDHVVATLTFSDTAIELTSGNLMGQQKNGTWVNGNLCSGPGDCYSEGDQVPHREQFTGLSNGTSYWTLISHDYQCKNDGTIGYTNFNNATGFSGADSVTLSYRADLSNADKHVWELGFIATDTAAEVRWNALLSDNAGACSGSNLHAYKESGGSQKVQLPVGAIVILGSITPIKATTNGANPNAWTFNIAGNTNVSGVASGAAASNLALNQNNAAATYTITEVGPSGWVLDSVTGPCTKTGDSTATVTLTSTVPDVSCTFTNRQLTGTIVVKKIVDPATDTGTFTFSGDVSGTIGNNQTLSATLTPGQYSATETVTSGYELTSIVCDDVNSTGDLGLKKATFNLEAQETVTCTFTNTRHGYIKVEKTTFPSSVATEFPVEISGTGTIVGSSTGKVTDGTDWIFEVVGGPFTVSEGTLPDDWDKTGETGCQNLTPTPGQTLTCSFTNTKRGHIIVNKVVDPLGDNTQFTIGVSALPGEGTVYGTATRPILGGGSEDFEVAPGTYNVTEDSLTGWNPDYACANIAVAAGETKTCTINNTKYGSITIVKDSQPDDSQNFLFDATGTGVSDFTLDDDTDPTFSNTMVFSNLLPGAYSFTEGTNDNWNQSLVDCRLASGQPVGVPNIGSVSIALTAGQNITCTFTNTIKRGSITIVKTAIGLSDVDFTFDPDWVEGTFDLSGGGSQTFSNLLPGSYAVAEQPQTGWDLTDIVCSGDGDKDTEVDLVDGEALISLDPAENITCTFTNTERGHLIVQKTTSPEDNTTEFEITTTGSGTIKGTAARNLTGGSEADYEVTPGTFSVSETDIPDGWGQTSNNCTAVEVAAGHTEYCQITNTQTQGTIIIHKADQNEHSLGGATFRVCKAVLQGDPICFEVTDNDSRDNNSLSGTIELINLPWGDYTVSEIAAPIGYDLDSDSCSAIVSGTNLTASCWFFNRLTPILSWNIEKTPDKTSVSNGDTITYTINVNNNGNVTINNVVVKDALPGGLEYVTGSSTLMGISIADPDLVAGTLQWSTGMDLSAGEKITITYQAKMTASTAGDYTNIAIAEGCRVGGGPTLFAAISVICIKTQTDPVDAVVSIGKTIGQGGQLPIAQVLGAATELPATGSTTSILVIIIAAIVIGLGLKYGGKLPIKKGKKHGKR